MDLYSYLTLFLLCLSLPCHVLSYYALPCPALPTLTIMARHEVGQVGVVEVLSEEGCLRLFL